jgi:hypothetical protein
MGVLKRTIIPPAPPHHRRRFPNQLSCGHALVGPSGRPSCRSSSRFPSWRPAAGSVRTGRHVSRRCRLSVAAAVGLPGQRQDLRQPSTTTQACLICRSQRVAVIRTSPAPLRCARTSASSSLRQRSCAARVSSSPSPQATPVFSASRPYPSHCRASSSPPGIPAPRRQPDPTTLRVGTRLDRLLSQKCRPVSPHGVRKPSGTHPRRVGDRWPAPWLPAGTRAKRGWIRMRPCERSPSAYSF